MFGLLGMLGLASQIRTENIKKFYYKGLEATITESSDPSKTIEIVIKREWKYTGFENMEEALEFAGKKTAELSSLNELKPILEKVSDLLREYNISFDEFLKIAKEALDEKIERPNLPLPPNFLWTSEPENEQDTSSSEASEHEDSEAS